MEPVEEDGQDIDEAMRTITRGGQREVDLRRFRGLFKT
jgi:hypothetical protein